MLNCLSFVSDKIAVGWFFTSLEIHFKFIINNVASINIKLKSAVYKLLKDIVLIFGSFAIETSNGGLMNLVL